MRRLLLSSAVLSLVTAGAAHAATKTYSTGTINAPIGARFERSLTVPDRGPVSFVRVVVPDHGARHLRAGDLARRPSGTEVPAGHPAAAQGPTSAATSVAAAASSPFSTRTRPTNPIAGGSAPFADGPYRPEGNLSALYGEDARGRWTLRVANGGRPARLNCFTLDISRDVPQTLSARSGTVAATVTYIERNFLYEKLRVRITRARPDGARRPDPAARLPGCANDRPSAVKIRDLDGGEPEVLVDLFIGRGALLPLHADPPLGRHCEAATARPSGTGATTARGWSTSTATSMPEFSAFDERFVYEYTAYVFSSAPIRDLELPARASSWTSRAGSRHSSGRALRPISGTT